MLTDKFISVYNDTSVYFMKNQCKKLLCMNFNYYKKHCFPIREDQFIEFHYLPTCHCNRDHTTMNSLDKINIYKNLYYHHQQQEQQQQQCKLLCSKSTKVSKSIYEINNLCINCKFYVITIIII
jgi:hypothetical protein